MSLNLEGLIKRTTYIPFPLLPKALSSQESFQVSSGGGIHTHVNQEEKLDFDGFQKSCYSHCYVLIQTFQ